MEMTENIFSNTHPEAGLAANGHSKFWAKRVGGKRCFEEPRFELRQTRSGSGSSAMWVLPGTQSVLIKVGKTNKTNQDIRSQNYINVYQKKDLKKAGPNLGLRIIHASHSGESSRPSTWSPKCPSATPRAKGAFSEVHCIEFLMCSCREVAGV